MDVVRVLNTTRDCPVATTAEVARGPVRRGLGLMGRRSWPSSDGLVLEHCNSIHSFFMRMPIDVLYVDGQGDVVRALPGVRPWRIGPISWKTKWVLELPTGAIERSGTRVGDRLEVVRA
jgi:uncharacterized protein